LFAAVERCLMPGGIGTLAAWCIGGMDALVAHPHFRLPNDLVTIPPRAFEGTSLTHLTFPATVTTIGDGAFMNCASLTSIALPDTVTTIGSGAFAGCCSLSQLTLPAALTTLGKNAFDPSTRLAHPWSMHLR